MRAVGLVFDVSRSFGVLWRTIAIVVAAGILTALIILGIDSAIEWSTGKDASLMQSPIGPILIVSAFIFAFTRCSLAIPITVLEGHSSRLSIKRSWLLTSFRRSKATIGICLLAYSPLIAFVLIGPQIVAVFVVALQNIAQALLFPLYDPQTVVAFFIGKMLTWMALTAAVFFVALVSTGCYLFIRPGRLQV